MDKGERQLQVLSVFVHGVLTAFHVLGIIYNLKRKNWGDVGVHGTAAAYSLSSANKHLKALESC